MPVTIESAGTHAFDLGHLRRQGGPELIELLLLRAGLRTDLHWRLQVQKKLFCNGETPPVRIVDEPKKWAVYLKIKPGDNNSCHYCSLLMPDGLQGRDVYFSLKKVEQVLDRNWRYKALDKVNGTSPDREREEAAAVEPVPAPEVCTTEEPAAAPADSPEPAPLPPEPAEPPPAFLPPPPAAATPLTESSAMPPPKDLPKPTGAARGWVSDPERIRLLLLAIHEINQKGSYPQEQFVQLLCQQLSLDGLNRYEIGGLFTALVRKELVVRVVRGTRPFGYTLTDEGRLLIKDLTVPPPPPPPPPRVEERDLTEVLRGFGTLAQKLVEATQRLEGIASREAELNSEIDRLRKERSEIVRLLDNADVQKTLRGLLRSQ
jgi:uncharacterized Zn-finger protein